MKLIRNESPDGIGKYAVTRNRDGKSLDGGIGSADEFFVLLLRDKYAQPALKAYADAVRADDPEYAAEIDDLAARSGTDSPHCRKPD